MWEEGKTSALRQVEEFLRQLWAQGYRSHQVAVISYRGVVQSQVLKQERLAGYRTQHATGYDPAGNVLWAGGELLVESLYCFKGQSAPAVVLCKVDFEELTDRERRKLFVGATRTQMRGG